MTSHELRDCEGHYKVELREKSPSAPPADLLFLARTRGGQLANGRSRGLLRSAQAALTTSNRGSTSRGGSVGIFRNYHTRDARVSYGFLLYRVFR